MSRQCEEQTRNGEWRYIDCPLKAPARRAVNAIRMMATCDTCQVRDKETCAVCTTQHALNIANELEAAIGK